MYGGMFSNTAGLYPRDASSARGPLQLWQPQMSSDITKWFLRSKSAQLKTAGLEC